MRDDVESGRLVGKDFAAEAPRTPPLAVRAKRDPNKSAGDKREPSSKAKEKQEAREARDEQEQRERPMTPGEQQVVRDASAALVGLGHTVRGLVFKAPSATYSCPICGRSGSIVLLPSHDPRARRSTATAMVQPADTKKVNFGTNALHAVAVFAGPVFRHPCSTAKESP